jgi:hypothetical protein
MVLRPGTQPFTRAVRGATHSIIYREPARPSAYIPTGEPRILEETPQGTTIMAEAVAAEPFAIAWTNGRILRSVLAGMDAKGYSESRGRRDMRSEFDEILDELWSRGSRSVFFEPQTVSAIMREAGVCNLASKVKGIGRFTHFAREFGLELAIQRAVPEELLAKAYPL